MTKIARTVSFTCVALTIAAIVLAQSTTTGQTQTSQTGGASATASARGGGSGNGSTTTGPWRDPSKEVYALIYSPGPSWDRNKSVYEQNLADHAKYMGDLLRANVLLLGGPFKDNSGGLAIIQVSNGDDAMIVAANDPAVKSRVMNVVARPWHIAFERGSGVASAGGTGGPAVSTGGVSTTGTSRGGGG